MARRPGREPVRIPRRSVAALSAALLACPWLVGCQATSLPAGAGELLPRVTRGGCDLEDAEERLGTEDGRRFHDVVTSGRLVPLVVDGFLVGLERTDREIVGAPKAEADPSLGLSGLEPDVRDYALDQLDRAERYFVSHLTETRAVSRAGRPARLDSHVTYSVYDDACVDPPPEGTLHQRGVDALGSDLPRRLAAATERAREAGTPFTHVVVMATGWNSYQRESIDRYNAWIAHMVDVAEERGVPFAPLVVGLTWTSRWAASGASLKAKAGEADAVGLTWGRLVLEAVVAGRREGGYGVLLVGHSFGARMLARAALSPLSREGAVELGPGSVELFAGLQAAVPVECFAAAGLEGCRYASQTARISQILLTSSAHDEVLAHAHTLQARMDGTAAASVAARALASSYGLATWRTDATGAVTERTPAGSASVVLVEADQLVNHRVLGHAGGAHADVFRRATMALVVGALAEGPSKPRSASTSTQGR